MPVLVGFNLLNLHSDLTANDIVLIKKLYDSKNEMIDFDISFMAKGGRKLN